jgi:hypothetical protein
MSTTVRSVPTFMFRLPPSRPAPRPARDGCLVLSIYGAVPIGVNLAVSLWGGQDAVPSPNSSTAKRIGRYERLVGMLREMERR